VTVRGGPSVSFMDASDFVERNLAGLAPGTARPLPRHAGKGPRRGWCAG
jgi:hypothetical protein